MILWYLIGIQLCAACYATNASEILYLTPYIESHKISAGQAAAQVKPFVGNITSYSGFFTVNKEYNSNIFFWFFPTTGTKDWESVPVVLWLQGGPGASSLFALFTENGPYVFKQNLLKERYYSWTTDFNVLYVDNPVGAGFSFTESDKGYATNQNDVASNLYEALRQFFLLFPNLRKNEFILTGESYAGRYIPAIAYAIHSKNPTAEHKINMFGLFFGNPLLNVEDMLLYGEHLYAFGLLDENGRDIFLRKEEDIRVLIKSEEFAKASNELAAIFFEGRSKVPTLFSNLTGIGQHYHMLSDHMKLEPFVKFLKEPDTKNALHVGNLKWGVNGRKVYNYLNADITTSIKPRIEELLEHYRILIYTGQLDIICPFFMVENALLKLHWSGAVELTKAQRQILYIGRYIAGYYKTAKTLTEVLIRNAGHMVPTDQPQWARMLLRKFAAKEFDVEI